MKSSSEPPPLPSQAGRATRPHRSKVGVVVIPLVLVAVGAFGYETYRAFMAVRESSILKSNLPRQPAAGVDQFFLENEDRIFLRYDELVGPDNYIKAYSSLDGADISFQFPLRRFWGETLPVRLPDGTTVLRNEVLAAVSRSGYVATYPQPEDDKYVSGRVYRLDNGVTFRDWHVVNLPADPAGRQGRDQDGVHTYQLPDGGRFEITYRGGVPEGVFRAYHADGKLWGEATYRHGQVVAASHLTRDGRKYDELAKSVVKEPGR